MSASYFASVGADQYAGGVGCIWEGLASFDNRYFSLPKPMRKLSIGVVDVLARSATKSLYARAMRANLASIMPQVVAAWCARAGHDVHVAYYNGYENMTDELPDGLDVVFIGAFTTSAQLAYAFSHRFRSKGAVTVLGGPHARAYPEHARQFFDYVLGFTDEAVIADVLHDPAPHRPYGEYLSATRQPATLPGLVERWPYVDRLRKEAPVVAIIPMIGSLGCPYTCSFCVDAPVPYQPLPFEEIQRDLRFLLTKVKKPVVGWHDPNFGVRMDDYLDAIEEAVPNGQISFIAESSLSLLTEPNVKRLAKCGFKAALPGIESWFEMGNKSKTGRAQGIDKVERVAEHVNMVQRFMPYLQANFVLGLDSDEGEEPFELTKRFLDLAPGAFPAFSMLTSFGRSAPLNVKYIDEKRLIPFPFHFLNNTDAMNVRPKNYSWLEFYDYFIDLLEYAFSPGSIYRRLRANHGGIPRALNVVRAISVEGQGKVKRLRKLRQRLAEDRVMRDFFEGETDDVPAYFTDWIIRDLGPMAEWLPREALTYDPYALPMTVSV